METPNLSYIHEISGGDESFEQELIQVLKTEFPIEKENYYAFVKNDLKKNIAEIVHKIKHKFVILDMKENHQIAMKYEESLKQNSYSQQAEFEQALEIISSYIHSI